MDAKEMMALLDQIFSHPLITVNQTPVTLSSLLVFALTLALFILISKALNQIILGRVLGRIGLETGTKYTLSRVIQYVFWFVGGFIAFQFIGIDLSGLAVIFGFLSVGIGFGLQNLTSNFVSGIILLFEQHIRVGDRVTVAGTEGDVVEINIRSTTIRSLNNVSMVVPNQEFISGTVINWSYGDLRTRVEIDVGVSYDSDLDTVMRTLLEAATEHPQVLQEPRPEVWFMGFGDSSWNMRLLAWVDTPKGRIRVVSDINSAIVRKFRQHNVEIPYPQRDLHWRSPLPMPVAPNA